jgi:hypothetical protein
VLHAEGRADMSKAVVAFRDGAAAISVVSLTHTLAQNLTYMFSFTAKILSLYPKHFSLKHHQLAAVKLLAAHGLLHHNTKFYPHNYVKPDLFLA